MTRGQKEALSKRAGCKGDAASGGDVRRGWEESGTAGDSAAGEMGRDGPVGRYGGPVKGIGSPSEGTSGADAGRSEASRLPAERSAPQCGQARAWEGISLPQELHVLSGGRARCMGWASEGRQRERRTARAQALRPYNGERQRRAAMRAGPGKWWRCVRR